MSTRSSFGAPEPKRKLTELSAPKQHHAHQHLARIRSSLDLSVQAISAFRTCLKSIRLETPPEQVEALLRQNLQQSRDRQSEHSPTQADDLRRYEVAITSRFEKLSEGLAISAPPPNRPHDSHSRILLALGACVESLVAKNRSVHEVRSRPALLLSKLPSHQGLERTAELIFTPFSVSLAFEKDDYERFVRHQGSLGVHFEGLPINALIRRPSMYETLLHEDIHNLLEGWQTSRLDKTSQDYRKTKTWLRQYCADERASAPAGPSGKGMHRKLSALEVKERLGNIREEISSLSAKQILNAQHEELLCEAFAIVEHHRKLVSESGWIQDYVSALAARELRRKHENSPFEISATAGQELKKYVRTFERASWLIKDQDLAEHVGSLAAEIPRLLRTSIDALARASYIANKLGPDAQERMEALAIILPPDKWRHLSGLLEPAESAKLLGRLYDATHDYPPTLSKLRRVIECAERNVLGPVEINLVAERIDGFASIITAYAEDPDYMRSRYGELSPASKIGIKSVSDLRRFIATIGQVSNLTGSEWSSDQIVDAVALDLGERLLSRQRFESAIEICRLQSIDWKIANRIVDGFVERLAPLKLTLGEDHVREHPAWLAAQTDEHVRITLGARLKMNVGPKA